MPTRAWYNSSFDLADLDVVARRGQVDPPLGTFETQVRGDDFLSIMTLPAERFCSTCKRYVSSRAFSQNIRTCKLCLKKKKRTRVQLRFLKAYGSQDANPSTSVRATNAAYKLCSSCKCLLARLNFENGRKTCCKCLKTRRVRRQFGYKRVNCMKSDAPTPLKLFIMHQVDKWLG